MAAASILISKFQIFNSQNAQEHQSASLCQIEPQLRYRDFWNLKNGSRRHLGFLKF